MQHAEVELLLFQEMTYTRDERLLDEFRDRLERDVESPDRLQAAHDPVVAVEDLSALVGLEALDVTRRGAAVEAAGPQPDVRDVNR